MLEGLLRHTNTVLRVVVQWGIEQGVAECTRLGVILQEDKGPGVAEGRMCGTGGQHIVQSGRQLLVAYFERGSVARKVDS